MKNITPNAHQSQARIRKNNTDATKKKCDVASIAARIEAEGGTLATQAGAAATSARLMLKMRRMGKTMVFADEQDPPDLNPMAVSNQNNKLDYWPDKKGPMPNPLTRSPLFAVVKPGYRRWMERKLIASRSGARIEFSGRQLDQADCDVWLQALQTAKRQNLGTTAYFNRSQFLKEMGRKVGGRGYRWLDDALHRLVVATIRVETKRYLSTFGLLDGYDLDKKTGEYWLSISPKAKAAFDRNDTTHVDWQQRLQIGRGQQLAKWLQDYVYGHARGQQHTIGIEKLYQWSGTKGRLRNFRSTGLPRALKELERVGIIEKAEIRKDGMVTWLRPVSLKSSSV